VLTRPDEGDAVACLAPNDFPGSSAEASAANAAVSAAAPAIIHRRVRLILVSAASRARTAGAGLCPPAGIFWSRPMVAIFAKAIMVR
jgi:hypothetical protein